MGKMKEILTDYEESRRLDKIKHDERIARANKRRKKRLSKDEIFESKWN